MSDPIRKVVCHVCGAVLVTWESAQTKFGLRLVCIDGEACARRANGAPRLTVVKGSDHGNP